jgi:hypothetical protein
MNEENDNNAEVTLPKIIWNEYYQNWPGRLRYAEARVNRGTATAEEIAEVHRLRAVRDEFYTSHPHKFTRGPEGTACYHCGYEHQ